MHRPFQPRDRVRAAPGPRIFRLGQLRAFGFPRTRVLEPRRRRSCRLPCTFSPWAVPAMDLRVSSKLACLSAAGFVGSAGCPASPLPPLQRLRYSPQVALRSVPSGFTGDRVPGRPGPRILRRCRLADSRVAPLSGPSVSPTIRSSSCPASRIFRLRLVFGQVTLNRTPSVSASQLQLPVALRLPLPAGSAA